MRGSAAYSKNDKIRPAALLAKERADAAKYKAQVGMVKAQADRTKLKLNEQSASRTEFPGQNNQQFEVGSCKVAALASSQYRVRRRMKCSKLAKTTAESKIDSRIVHLNNGRAALKQLALLLICQSISVAAIVSNSAMNDSFGLLPGLPKLMATP